MDPSTLGLLTLLLAVVACVLLLLVLVTLLGRKPLSQGEVGSAISRTWIELGLEQVIGQVKLQAEQIGNTHKTLEQMLRSPSGRASFGELSLEVMLADQLPLSYFGIRKQCVEGK